MTTDLDLEQAVALLPDFLLAPLPISSLLADEDALEEGLFPEAAKRRASDED